MGYAYCNKLPLPHHQTLVKFTWLLDAYRVKFIYGCGPHLFIKVLIIVLPRKKRQSLHFSLEPFNWILIYALKKMED